MEIILLVVLAGLLVLMFFSSRNRQKKMREAEEQKQNQMVPGTRVLLQGGLYGTIVAFDRENLDAPAEVELAPGVVVDVHSQAVLRIVEDDTPAEDIPADDQIVSGDTADDDIPADDRIVSGEPGPADEPVVEDGSAGAADGGSERGETRDGTDVDELPDSDKKD